MKQEIGRAPDQRPVPVEILLHDQVMSCWRTASASISAKGMPVEMVVSFAPDGAIEGEPRIVDGARLKTDREFLLAAYTAARAVHGCSPFTLPSDRSEEHTSELQSLMRISYAVFCLKNNNRTKTTSTPTN